MKLHVVTPCSRPANLPLVEESLYNAIGETKRRRIDVEWLVVHDCLTSPCEDFIKIASTISSRVAAQICHFTSRGSVAGHGQVNAAFELLHVNGDFVWRLDDDNLCHPHFLRALSRLDARKAHLVLFAQIAAGRHDEAEWPGGIAYPVPVVSKMDSAQYVYRRDALGPLRLKCDWYNADGQLAEDLYARVGADKTLFVADPVTSYNAIPR